MGVFSITPLKNKNPPLGEGLSAIWEEAWLLPFFVSTALGPAAPGARMRSPAQSRALSFGFANSCFMSADSG
ncbi:putative non-ribosomal peptide synthase domain protein [Burkholderia pseudomallei MSHR7504]|nr:putative non-ribosomal peptide synthase domain protein [Burkholderia pseudomallei MSHR7504]